MKARQNINIIQNKQKTVVRSVVSFVFLYYAILPFCPKGGATRMRFDTMATRPRKWNITSKDASVWWVSNDPYQWHWLARVFVCMGKYTQHPPSNHATLLHKRSKRSTLISWYRGGCSTRQRIGTLLPPSLHALLLQICRFVASPCSLRRSRSPVLCAVRAAGTCAFACSPGRILRCTGERVF